MHVDVAGHGLESRDDLAAQLTGRSQPPPQPRGVPPWTMQRRDTRPAPRTVVRFPTVGVCNTAIDVVLFWVLHAPLGIVAGELRLDLGRDDLQLPGQRPPHLRGRPA